MIAEVTIDYRITTNQSLQTVSYLGIVIDINHTNFARFNSIDSNSTTLIKSISPRDFFGNASLIIGFLVTPYLPDLKQLYSEINNCSEVNNLHGASSVK